MKHQICVDSTEFVQAIKDASSYAGRDNGKGMDHVLLTVLPRLKKLSVVACDGFGYYERRLNLEHCKKQPKPSLPGKEMRLVICLSDVSMLVKFIPSKLHGNIRLELDDEQIAAGSYSVNLVLPNGMSTTFFSKAEADIPDLASIRTRAEKGKKKAPALNNVHIPVHELLRAGRVFPGKGTFAQMFTASGLQDGIMALLECKNYDTDISVIFMLSNNAAQSAA